MNNIEIKAPLVDVTLLAQKAETLGAAKQRVLHQIDTFFNVPLGYLKLREISGLGAELIAYSRESGSGPRASDYVVATISDALGVAEALTRSLGVRGRVEKERTLYLFKHTRIHLDDVRGLGAFLELETVMDGIDRGRRKRRLGVSFAHSIWIQARSWMCHIWSFWKPGAVFRVR